MAIALGVAVIALALILIVSVLMQSGKDTRLSGTIAGGAETFFGKSKASTWDKMLSKVTVALSIVFALVVIAMYLFV